MDIEENISLKEHTTFDIGGPARFFVVVKSPGELEASLIWAQEKKQQYFILAGGSNVVFSDEGFDGLVIKIAFDEIVFDGTKVTCGSGVILLDFIKQCAEKGLAGLENLAGVPGTVGGALRGNAGAFGTEISDVSVSVTALERETKEMKTLSKKECHFLYRNSVFKSEEQFVILAAVFNFMPRESTQIVAHMKEIIQERNARHIQKIKSAGSFFMNPVVSEEIQEQFYADTGKKSRGGRVPAGWLLECVGLDQKRIGDIQAGEMHANYFINVGEGTAQQVIQLASLAKARVRNQFGVQLKEEVTLVGF